MRLFVGNRKNEMRCGREEENKFSFVSFPVLPKAVIVREIRDSADSVRSGMKVAKICDTLSVSLVQLSVREERE